MSLPPVRMIDEQVSGINEALDTMYNTIEGDYMLALSDNECCLNNGGETWRAADEMLAKTSSTCHDAGVYKGTLTSSSSSRGMTLVDMTYRNHQNHRSLSGSRQSLTKLPLKLSKDSLALTSQANGTFFSKQQEPLYTTAVSLSGLKRPHAGAEVASIFAKPSAFFRQLSLEKDAVDNTKRPRQQEPLLHRACCLPGISETEIRQLLQKDAAWASMPAVVYTTTSAYDPLTRSTVQRRTKEPYQYALNLAIRHKLSPAILELLLTAAPHVALVHDGSLHESSLAIALKYLPDDTATADRIMLSNPHACALQDKQGNTPLHVACARGAIAETVRHLVLLYPEALEIRNKLGKTPKELAV
jgi:hypothetical protein